MGQRLYGVRGAVQVLCDDPEQITASVLKMYDDVVLANNILLSDMVSIQFTMTKDLGSLNPATALRSREKNFPVPLFCMQEPEIQGMMERMIRMLIHFYAPEGHIARHAYLGGASALRPDWQS